MKTFGIVLLIVGGLMVMSGLKLMVTEYDMSDTNDISKSVGSLGVSVALIAAGAYLVYKKPDKDKTEE